MASGVSRLSYTPQPQEQAYFEALFQAADTQRGGAIGGSEAVRFFSSSKLPIEALKSIWTVADQPATNSLDRQKFAVAVRLIQLLQNGQKGQGADLSAPPGVVLKPVLFEGFSGVSVPMPPPGPASAPAPPAGPPMTPQRPPLQPPPQQQQGRSMQSLSDSSIPSQYSHQPPQQQPSSRSLAVQDPYTMTPQEQSRYEALFPQYAKPDGFCYGPEAVALFSKSGVPQPHLASLWNMVDAPVDNRLDKLEFAMAMHLIVCLSKKNLPMPPALPHSLKLLKQGQQQVQHHQQQQAPPQVQTQQLQQQQQQQPQHQPPPSPMANMSMTGPPAGQSMSHMQPPPLQANVSSMTSFGGNASGTRIASPQTVHRTSVAPPASPGRNLPGPPPLQQPGGMSISDAFEGINMGGSGGASMDDQSYLQSSSPVPTATSFDMNGSTGGGQGRVPSPPSVTEQPSNRPPKTSDQLKQAYQMDSSSGELTKLKEILQKLQAENISLKASMGHLNEEEREVQRELGSVVSEIGKLSNELTTLRAKVLASKSRLMEAAAELKAAKEKKSVIQDLIGEATETRKAIDDAYEGIERANAALQDTTPASTQSFDDDLFGFGGGDGAPAPAATAAPTQQEPSAYQLPAVSNVGSFASQESQPSYHVEQQSSYESRQSEPAHERSPSYQPYNMPLNNFGQESANNYYGGGPTHRKNQSTGSFGNIMGGDVGALPPENNSMSMYAVQETLSTMDDVSGLKKKLKEAEDVAREAEDSRRSIAAELDEFRRVADEADQKARQFQVDLDKQATKKKGLLGGRGKKKDAKEGEQLSADSNQKKSKVMQVQAQLKDAESLANDTKKEAERLKKEVEDAEVSIASAASMLQSPSVPSYSYASPPQSNDYEAASSLDAAPQWFPQNQPTPVFNGDGGMGGFNSHVMGGGAGNSISEPATGSADPYSNPFE